MTPAEFAAQLREDYLDAKLQKARKPRPHHTNHPHSAGHPCDRYLVLLRVAWGLQTPPSDPIKAALFQEGHHQEHALVTDLRDLHGYRVALQNVPVALPDLEVTGEWDFCLRRGEDLYMVSDAKGVSPGIFRSLNTVQDLLDHRRHFIRQWPIQLLLYLEAARRDRVAWAHVNPDVALLILKDKVTGDIKPVPIPWDEDIMEYVHARLRIINQDVRKIVQAWMAAEPACDVATEYGRQTLRPLLPTPLADGGVCPSCPYYHFCQVEPAFVMPIAHAEVVEDPDLEEALEERERRKAEHEAFEEADADVKALLKGYTFGPGPKDKAYLVVGPFLITAMEIRPKGKPPYWKHDIWRRPDPPK